jgi:hypothetical protein
MTIYLPVGSMGDSNTNEGQYYDYSLDTTNANVFQWNGSAAVLASEPLDNPGGDTIPHHVGSALKLCIRLQERGYVPAGCSPLIVPLAYPGTSMANGWGVNSNSFKALDPAITALQAAVAYSGFGRMWFFDWNHGMNEFPPDNTLEGYRANMIAMWAKVRSMVPGSSRAPILVTRIPLDPFDPLVTGLTPPTMIEAEKDVASYLYNSAYIDPTSSVSMVGADPTVAAAVAANGGPENLHSYQGNNFIHYSACSHRGGANNADYLGANNSFTYNPAFSYLAGTAGSDSAIGTDRFIYMCISSCTGIDPSFNANPTHWRNTTITYDQNVLYPLSERKYTALLNLGWRLGVT